MVMQDHEDTERLHQEEHELQTYEDGRPQRPGPRLSHKDDSARQFLLGDSESDPEDPEDHLQGDGEEPGDQAVVPWARTLKSLMSISWPIIVTLVLEMLPGLVNVIAVGHLGELELGSVTLGVMFVQVTGVAPAFGLAMAVDTLCAQAFGANEKKTLGVILQRGLVIEFLLFIPIAIVWAFCGHILALAGQDPAVVALTTKYVWMMLPGLYPLVAYEVLKKYLQAQHLVLPPMYVAIFANIWNAFANWFFVYQIGWGFIGAPFARMTTNVLLPVFMIIYIVYSKKCVDTWGGWSRECFSKWKEFLALGIPSLFMVCVEFWAFEAGALMAGLIGVVALAAQSIVLNVATTLFFIPLGCSIGASVLIGNALGANLPHLAKRVSQVSYHFSLAVGLASSALLIALKDEIPKIFTTDEEVIRLTASIFPVVATFQLFDGMQAIASGIMRGCGKQKVAAGYLFFGFYAIGLPLGGSLAFPAGMGLIGLWIGLAVALFIIASIGLAVVYFTKWDKESQKARARFLSGEALPVA